MIVQGGTGNALTYNLPQTQMLHVEAISADVDCSAAGADSVCDAIYRDNAGLLIARARSSQSLVAGSVYTVTFAPNLPDSQTLLNFFPGTVVTTGLPDTILPGGGSIRVQVQDAAANVTQVRLWVDDVEDGSGELETFGAWAYVPGPGA
jgi:hypothetical protein